MNDISFSRTIFKGKGFSLDFFFHAPRMAVSDRGRFSEEIYPMLYFRQNTFGQDPSGNRWADKTIKIRPRGMVRFVNAINKACKWFENEDIFMENDDGEVIFNHDYSKLKIMMKRAEPDDGSLAIIPAAVPDGADQKPVEGVILYINKLENLVMIPYYELDALLWTLTSFSFTEEMNHMIMATLFGQTNRTITSGNQVRKGPF